MSRPVLLSLIGLAAAIVAIVLALKLGRDDVAVDSPSVPSASAPVAGPALNESVAPSFDVVRIGERGDAVIAGRAMPKADVDILDNGVEIGRTIADGRGEWVFLPGSPMAPGAHALTLRAHNPDGLVKESAAPVILVVPANPGQALAFKPMPGGGVQMLMGPAVDAGGIALDLVERDDKGVMHVSGRGPVGGLVQLYVDNVFVGRAQVGKNGQWQVSGKAPAGEVKLRADLVDAKGKVLARVELPYAAGAVPVLHAGGSVVVAPGNSLWRIARRLYGAGTAYTVIYQANKDSIKDPDLIYPGQMFQIPKR